MTLTEGIAAIEAVMFAYGDPITIEKLSEASGVDAETCAKLVDRLEQQYNVRESGLRILRINNGFQIAARTEFVLTLAITSPSLTLSPILTVTSSTSTFSGISYSSISVSEREPVPETLVERSDTVA